MELWSVLGCLRQPVLLLDQPQKPMREKVNPFVKFCGTLTVSSPGTKSIGLVADALVPCFLLAIWTFSS